MAKPVSPKEPTEVPREFAEVPPPRDLHSTSDIRFVMRETATLTERIEGLTKAIDKLGPTFEKELEKYAADMKERFTELKVQAKETSDSLSTVKSSIDSFKGAMKVLGGVYALILVVMGALLAWFLRPLPPPPDTGVAPPQAVTTPLQQPHQNSN